jgi:hypothetical protein
MGNLASMWLHRADGDVVRGLPNTRRVMPYMMRTRTESVVYFEYEASLVKTDRFISDWNQANPLHRIDAFHVFAWAVREAITRNPSMNRFVAGGRLYQRKGLWFSYAVKQKLETGAPLVVVKRRVDTDETFGEMVVGIQEVQASTIGPERSTVDRELGLLLAFPSFVRRVIFAALRVLDRFGMLPGAFIEKDPMYTSVFLGNLASLGMPAIYHHLYEYGTCGMFCAMGRPATDAGSPTSGPDRRRSMTMRFTFDERCEDGLAAWFTLRRIKQVLEDPQGSGIAIEALPVGTAAVESDVPQEMAPVQS